MQKKTHSIKSDQMTAAQSSKHFQMAMQSNNHNSPG